MFLNKMGARLLATPLSSLVSSNSQLLGLGLLALSMSTGASGNIYMLLIATSLLAVWMLRYYLVGISKTKYCRQLQLLLIIALTGQGVLSILEPANSFSLLFQATENVLRTCVLSQVAALVVLAAILFGFVRVVFMFGLAFAGYKIWSNRQQGQDYQELMQVAIVAVLLLVIFGAIEPLVVGTGCGGGGGDTGGNTGGNTGGGDN